MVELINLRGLHVSKDIAAFCGTTRTAKSLLDHFASLIVKHALMGHLLMAVAAVMVHLVTFRDTVTTSKGSLGACLVSLFDRITMLVSLHACHLLHRCKSALCHAIATHASHIHRLSHGLLHLVAHLADHLVHLSKAHIFKERIVSKRITSSAKQAFSEAFDSVVHELIVSLHHAIKWRATTTETSNLVRKWVSLCVLVESHCTLLLGWCTFVAVWFKSHF